MQQPTITLTEDQIAFFQRTGYLVLPAITTSAEVERLQGIYDQLFASKAGRDQGDHLDLVTTDEDEQTPVLPQILNPSKYAPALIDTLFRANAHAIAQQLLGPDIISGGDHAILKPPHTDAATPWHQDEAYWDAAKEYDALSIWIPLQEATLENGCMHFVPGVHQQGILPHQPIGNDPRIIGLEVEDADAWTQKAVACPIPAGGATIHHSRTLHYTGPNRTDQPRRAYILGFSAPTKPLAVPRDFYWQTMQKTKWQERATQRAQTPPAP
ncbi:MAG: phytanoyl-CoA dioxygenase family protein [Chloroflexi bacterium]|nr:phytanoyl-CoA dioxygenase family protein [Chloroflexota bacterium]